MLSEPANSPAIRLLIVHTMLLMCLACLCLSASFDAAHAVLLYGSALVYAGLFAWMLISWQKASGSYLNTYGLFLIAAVIFNGGQALLEVVGLNRNGLLDERFSEGIAVRTVAFCSLALASVHLGALIAAARRKQKRQSDEALSAANRSGVTLGFVLLAIAVVPTFLLFRTNVLDVISVGYFGLYQRELTTGLDAWQMILPQFLVPASFLLAAGSEGRKLIRLLSLLVIVLYVFLNFFMGYRGLGAAALIAYGWIWHTRVKRLPALPTLIAGLLLLFVLFPMIKAYRGTLGDERLDWGLFAQTLQTYENPAVSSISEMGNTMSTVAYTMEFVPATKDFEYGSSYAYAALTGLPNIFGTPLHPTVAHGTPSSWLVGIVDPRFAQLGGGLGYSFIAEAWLNFGWFGPALVLVPLGWLIATMHFWSERMNTAAARGVAATVLFYLLIYARAETANIVRGVLWYAVLPYATLVLVGSVGHTPAFWKTAAERA